MVREKTLASLRRRLEDECVRLRAELDDLRIDNDDQQTDYGVSNHPADDATELTTREQNLALRNNAQDLLAQAEAALGRMDAGTYGACARCGRPIDPERLEALPSVEYCITCQTEVERSR